MCSFYLRLSWSLARNLASRVRRELRDRLVLNKRRLLYRLMACLEGYDDCGPDDHASRQDLLQDIGGDLDNNNWFINADRKTAEELVLTGGEGCFLIRKSLRYPMTLTVLHDDSPFNIPLRRREDGRIALGSWKQNERTFDSVEDLVNYYLEEELILFRGGERAGGVVFSSPPDQLEVERRWKNRCHHIMVHVPQ